MARFHTTNSYACSYVLEALKGPDAVPPGWEILLPSALVMPLRSTDQANACRSWPRETHGVGCWVNRRHGQMVPDVEEVIGSVQLAS